jgi:ABC-2 type transport system permease protein
MTTAPAEAPLTLDTSGTPATPFLRLVQVEVRKTWDTRAGIWLLGTIVAITAAAMIIFFAVADPDDRIFANFIGFAATPQGFLLPVLGILLVTTEWSQRTAMVTFALEPSRTKVIASKVVAALVWGFGAFVAAVAIAMLSTLAGGADEKFEDVSLTVFLLFLALQLLTILQGLAYGLIFLNTPAAIVVFFVLPIASSIVFSVVSGLNDAAPWIDMGTAQEPLFSNDFDLTGEQYAQLATTSLIWIIAPFVAGWIRVMRAELK